MNFYDVTLFSHTDRPQARAHFSDTSFVINADYESYNTPRICIHFDNEHDVVRFKNSVIQAWKKYLKEESNNA